MTGINFPITVKKIIYTDSDALITCKIGQLVRIMPCAKKYREKTFLGIYLGNLPRDTITYFKESAKELEIHTRKKPAIFVPELQEVIYGDSSYWGEIESEEELTDITPEEIQNLWYIKALKSTTSEKNK